MNFHRPLHEVVNKDVAVFLREHGHDEYCDCYLHTDNDRQDDYEMWSQIQHCNSDLPDSAERIAAPYVTDALLWIMREYGVVCFCDREEDSGVYQFSLRYEYPEGWFHTVMGEGGDLQSAIGKALDLLVADEYFVRKAVS